MKILVVEACGLSLGFLGCYGNDWVGTPNLDRLAAEGLVFDAHILHQPRPEWMPETGSPWRHTRSGKLADFAQAAARAWDTMTDTGVCWIQGPILAPPWHLPADMLASYCGDQGDAWPDPPHGDVGPDFDIRHCQDTYAAVVTYFDEQMGRVFEHLENRGEYDKALIVLTACSGLPLGERGTVGLEALSLHEESVHVPMLWRLPQGAEAGTRIAALTQPADLSASLLTALGAPVTQGNDLWPLARGESTAVRSHARARIGAGADSQRLLRTPEWAYLQTADADGRLFVKPDDRWEVNDVRQQHPELVERFQQILQAPD